MSCKEYLIKLLKQGVRPPHPPILNQTPKRKSRIAYKGKITRRRPKKYLKHTKADCSSNSNRTLNNTSNNLIRNYSDSEVEFNISPSNENSWIDNIETDITPSKTECVKEELSEADGVDTVYHDSLEYLNDSILSPVEEISCDDGEGLILPQVKLEIAEVKQEKCINSYKNGRVIVIRSNNLTYLHGSFRLSVLCGNVNVLGYELSTISDDVDIYSLRGFFYLHIENTNHGGSYDLDQLRLKLEARGVHAEDISDIIVNWNSENAVLFCSDINDRMLAYVEKHIPQKLLPPNSSCGPLIIESKDDGNILQCNPEWDEICKLVDETSKLMICGGKGLGKSTFLKYTINKLLMNYDRILVIDLDPGQSEFTIAGCVSAVLVEKPIFGPSFTHLQEPERCVVVENIDISLEPEVYIQCVVELLQQCKCYEGIPTLVNFMGYSQSYGINITCTVVTFVAPTILLQINSSRKNKMKNYKSNLTCRTVLQYSSMFGAADTSELDYELILVDSMVEDVSTWQAQGRTTRDMCILSYFSKIVDESLSLTNGNVPLYKILLKDISLICNRSYSKTNKLAIFNASLVSLCTPATDTGIYNCHGWGIVRGIDQEMLVLITPVREDTLLKVTHLLLGSVSLPASLLMYEDEKVGLVPYVSVACRTRFNNIPKRDYRPKKST